MTPDPSAPRPLDTVPLAFRVAARIARPIDQVFEAVVNPAELSRYFTTGGARGRLETGAVVNWSFHDFPGAFDVRVDEVQGEGPRRRIVFRWDADDADAESGNQDAPAGPYLTTVTMTFEALEDGRTLVEVREEGWHPTPAGLRASYGNCSGWMQMLCALKGWLEHGVNLRDGMFR